MPNDVDTILRKICLNVEYCKALGTAYYEALSLYRQVQVLSKDLNGIRMLRILCVPNYWERLCEALDIVPVKYEEGYDAIDGDDRHVTHFFTGNLESLARIVDTYVYGKKPRLICIFTWQERFVVDALRIMGVYDRNNNRYAQADYNTIRFTLWMMSKGL